MSFISVDTLRELVSGNVAEFAVDTHMLQEAFHGLDAQMRLASMVCAVLANKKFKLPLEFLTLLAERNQQRCLELQFALRELGKCSDEFLDGEFDHRHPMFQDRETAGEVAETRDFLPQHGDLVRDGAVILHFPHHAEDGTR